jgi:hypothetical protein
MDRKPAILVTRLNHGGFRLQVLGATRPWQYEVRQLHIAKAIGYGIQVGYWLATGMKAELVRQFRDEDTRRD